MQQANQKLKLKHAGLGVSIPSRIRYKRLNKYEQRCSLPSPTNKSGRVPLLARRSIHTLHSSPAAHLIICCICLPIIKQLGLSQVSSRKACSKLAHQATLIKEHHVACLEVFAASSIAT